MTSLRDINEYLFLEFGVEGDESEISEHWPFRLQHRGAIHDPTGESLVYSFTEDTELFYAIDGPRALNFVPAAGMDLDALQTEAMGRRWVGLQSPVNLSMSLGSDSGVPSMLQRREALERLAAAALNPVQPVVILEGLYLRARSAYIGLFAVGDAAFLCLDSIDCVPALFPSASPHRRLSHAVGQLLQRGVLQ